jgi:acyl-coenzyme A thioesterase PaaI-like protein
MSPCIGDRLIARGEVAKAGRRLTVCRAEVVALRDGRETCIALMQATMIPVDP